MKSIFTYESYRNFLNDWIESQPIKGLKKKLANSANVSSTLISLILKGEKHLTLEQASEIADYVGLSDREWEYFFLLVEFGRAGTPNLIKKIRKRMSEQRHLAMKLSNRVKSDKELSTQEIAIYYSSWIYTGIRNLLATGKYTSTAEIAERLKVSPNAASKVLEFLMSHGLCERVNGKLTFGPAYIQVDADSPFVVKHHHNWRLRGIQQMDLYDESNLFFTCPMSISKEAATEIRNRLSFAIEDVLKIMGPVASEEVYCFNLDWFKY